MNKLVKLPIFLGICGGACAGILAGVNAFTAPIIKTNEENKANQAIYELFDGYTLTPENVKKNQPLSSALEGAGVTNKILIDSVDVSGMVYECHTSSAFGAINFQVAFANGKYLGYTDLGNEQTASIGGKAIQGLNTKVKGQTATNDNSFIVTSGATVTTTAIKDALDVIAADYLGGK